MTTDSAIIARSLTEPSAFAEVFERHCAAVGRFAAQRVGADAAADVLSETFLIAFRKRASFDSTFESARPWIYGIATRVIHRMRTQEAKQWRAMSASAALAYAADAADVDRADERADAAAAVHQLTNRIAALPQRDRETLLLYAWGDLTCDEIAVALKVPIGTVRSRLNRVRRRLSTPRGSTTPWDNGSEDESNGRTVEQGA